jgi:hypothetical protein
MTKLKEDSNHNCIVYYDDGDQTKIFATALNYNNLDHFKGWKCDAGFSRIYIHSDGNVWGGECNNDHLGSLKDNTFELLKGPTTCKKQKCLTSPDELMLKKYRLDN